MRGSTRTFQYRVTTSTLLLPATVILGVVWWLVGATNWQDALGGLFCYGAATYLIMELNNANALIRIRSRMASAVLVALWGMCQFLHPFQKAHIIILLVAFTYHLLFRAYNKHHTVGLVFLTFTALAICGLFHAGLLWLILPFIVAFAYFQALSPKALCAALLGLLFPIWVGGSLAFLTEQWQEVCNWLVPHLSWSGMDYSEWTLLHVVSLLFVWVLSFISIIHLMWNRFQDKIRTRDLLYFLSWMMWVYTALLFLYPQASSIWFLLLILNNSPLIGHFLVLTNTRWSNIFFMIVIGLWVLLAGFNLWMSLYSF